MSEWRSMENWRRCGPANGIGMLILFSDGVRAIGFFDGEAQQWKQRRYDDNGSYADHVVRAPVAWAPLPEIPTALRERNAKIAAQRAALDALQEAPL